MNDDELETLRAEIRTAIAELRAACAEISNLRRDLSLKDEYIEHLKARLQGSSE